MAKLIVKSPYIKCGGSNSAAAYLNYIGTRENVELFPDDRPPTRKQEQLISKLTKDFPDTKKLYEYEEYKSNPTKYRASEFISLALESHWNSIQKREGYMNYIATRPRAERIGAHGLFGDEKNVSLEAAMSELEQYQGNVWTHIFSLKREDAARLGFDHAAAWRSVLLAHRNDIAAAMKIPPNEFRWYAAFHDEGEHPHVHMMAWSATPGQAYLSTKGIEQIKSKLTNTIFQNEMLHIYERKSMSRDELVNEARRELRELTESIRSRICDAPELEVHMQELARQLESVNGKKKFGYLPQEQKKLVCKIVDEMAKLPTIEKCYERWQELQGQVESYYHDKEPVRLNLSEQKELAAIRNAVIYEAEQLRMGRVTFEDEGIAGQDEPTEFYDCSYEFEKLWNIIRDERYEYEYRLDAAAEVEQLAKEEDPHAQYLMGILYRDGSLLVSDKVLAKEWLTCAAENGLTEAMYSLGKLCLSDDPGVQDPELGAKWLQAAAREGHDFAAYRLGKECLAEGLFEKNIDTAVYYFKQAGEAGNRYAQYMLGKMYLEGDEIPYDKAEAYDWLSAAMSEGHRYARELMDHMDEDRSPSAMMSVIQLFHHMGNIFRENSIPPSGGGIHIDRKRWSRLQEKRMAVGHKRNDHPDHKGPNMTMTMY